MLTYICTNFFHYFSKKRLENICYYFLSIKQKINRQAIDCNIQCICCRISVDHCELQFSYYTSNLHSTVSDWYFFPSNVHQVSLMGLTYWSMTVITKRNRTNKNNETTASAHINGDNGYQRTVYNVFNMSMQIFKIRLRYIQKVFCSHNHY
jgi:hypothetical protein